MSKEGAGGVWFGLNKALPPLVWQVVYPSEIQKEVVSEANPRGKYPILIWKGLAYYCIGLFLNGLRTWLMLTWPVGATIHQL